MVLVLHAAECVYRVHLFLHASWGTTLVKQARYATCHTAVDKMFAIQRCQQVVLVMLQSMVWCNQLVTALARFLRSIAQPSILAHASHQAAQQHIVHLMQALTQPSVISVLGWESTQQGPKTVVSTQSGLACPKPKKMAAGSTLADGQMLDVIRVSDIKHCRQR